MNMKVVVTGAAGMIGSNLVHGLNAIGIDDVIAVDDLLDPAHRSTWVHPAGFQGPAFVVGDLYIWGFTAYLLDELFDLLGWTRPWRHELRTEIPARFLDA